MSERETILDAVATVLANGPAAPAGLTVHREPDVPLEEDAEKALVVFPRREDVELETHGPDGPTVARLLEIGLEVRVALTAAEREAGILAHTALNTLAHYATNTLLGDLTLGGATTAVREIREVETRWAKNLSTRLRALAEIQVDVLYSTPEVIP